MRRTISATGMNDFMTCPTLYDLSRTWEAKVRKPAFSMGTLVHALVQGWHSGQIKAEDIQGVAWQYRDNLIAEYNEFARTNPEFQLSSYIDGLKHDVSLAIAMVNNYITHWGERLPVDPKNIEVPFTFLLANSHWFRGFMDMVIPMEDHVQVFEIKTTSGDVGGLAMSDLYTNQSIGYIIAAEKVFKKPAVIVYDMLKKAAPGEMEPLLCKKTKQHDRSCCNGTLISGASKSKKSVLKPVALQWFEERPWIDREPYTAYLDSLDETMRRYFHRKTVDVPLSERESWLENALQISRLAHSARGKRERYKCWTSCSSRYGQCKFYGYCRSQDEFYLETYFKKRGEQ